MSADEEQEVIFSTSASDWSIMQRTSNSSGSKNTSVNKGPKGSMVTNPSLVNKTLCDLNAKIEELQQEATQTNSMMQSRDNYVERRFKEQEREISSLRRKNFNSSEATGSNPKLPRRTEKSKQAVTVKQKAPVITIPEEATISLSLSPLRKSSI